MRIERTYTVSGGGHPRVDAYIEVVESIYCESKECEARHDDPTVKWDQRVNRLLAEVPRRADAERIVKALEELDRREGLACSNTVVGLKGQRVQHRKSGERGVLLGPAGPSAWIVEVDDTGAVRRWHRDHVDLVDLEQEGQEIAGDGERW